MTTPSTLRPPPNMGRCPPVDADGNVGEGEGIEDGGSPRTKAKTAGDKDNQDARGGGGGTPTILTSVQQGPGKNLHGFV